MNLKHKLLIQTINAEEHMSTQILLKVHHLLPLVLQRPFKILNFHSKTIHLGFQLERLKLLIQQQLCHLSLLLQWKIELKLQQKRILVSKVSI